jgi:hypothetical protein
MIDTPFASGFCFSPLTAEAKIAKTTFADGTPRPSFSLRDR